MSPEQRRRCMQANKSKNTSIEVLLGRALWHRGLRYRKHEKTVPGHPDFCFKGKKVAVFCDGEFWHGRNWEQNKHRIHSHQEFWCDKIERNQRRDAEVNQLLRREGWQVLRFWETDIRKHLDSCVQMVEAALNGASVPDRVFYEYIETSNLLAAEAEVEYGKKEVGYQLHTPHWADADAGIIAELEAEFGKE